MELAALLYRTKTPVLLAQACCQDRAADLPVVTLQSAPENQQLWALLAAGGPCRDITFS